VAARARGSTANNSGNATIHDRPHAPSHNLTNPWMRPTLLQVLSSETMQVMASERKNGNTTA
jgi:hypothetical protein